MLDENKKQQDKNNKLKKQQKNKRFLYLKNKLDKKELIRLYPSTITMSPDQSRPILILKDKNKKYTLPVWLNAFEAGLAAAQNNINLPPFTPHNVAYQILKNFSINVERCLFTEIVGSHQYVTLDLKEKNQIHSIKIKADEAISFCLYLKVPLYSTIKFMKQSKLLNDEFLEMEKGMRIHPALLIPKKYDYLM